MTFLYFTLHNIDSRFMYLTWYKRNHRSNHLLLSAHLLYKNPANLESYLAFSANPRSWPSFIRMERWIRCTLGLSIIPDIWKWRIFLVEGNNFTFNGNFVSWDTSPKVNWSRCNSFSNQKFNEFVKYFKI